MSPTALWQNILAHPGNPALKSQFISSLKSSHDSRPQIFRLAAALETFPPYYVQHDAFAKQYESALNLWRPEFTPLLDATHAQLTFIGGWPIELSLSAADFILHAQRIVSTLPLLHLNLTALAAAPEVFHLPQFAQIASLNLSHQPASGPPIQSLVSSPHLSSLRWLDLSHAQLTESDVELLAASPTLRHLEHLDLRNNLCPDPVDAALGYGSDGNTGLIVPDSIFLPEFGKQLESRHGPIKWLHALDNYMEKHPPNRYQF